VEATRSFGPWQAVEKLGQGGVCEVWRARHANDPTREVAIKVLADVTAENVARFVDEADLLRKIDHPNVLGVHDLAADERPPWFVMDLLRGRDLDALRDQGPVAPHLAARLIAQVADGLAAVHALGVRHRDIKPGNIVVGDDGVPKLIDFGIARRIHDTHRTRQGMVVGTAAYLPPEVWSGQDPHGAQDSEAADVFALGQTLCELLIGKPIYEREGDTTLLVAILRDKLDRDALDPRVWEKEIPDGLAEVVVEATLQDVERRISTAATLRDRLDDWLDGRNAPAPAPPAPPPKATPAPAGGSGVLAWTAGGGLVAAGLLSVATVVGVALLWALRPVAPVPADPTAVREAVVTQAAALVPCADLGPGTVTATWVVQGEAAWHVRADATTASPEVTACVLAAIGAMRFPDGSLAVTLPVVSK